MDDWRIQPQQQQRINMNGIGPIHSYHHLMHSKPSPYQVNQIKQTYPYQQSSAVSVKTDLNSDVYTSLPYTPNHMEHIYSPQRLNPTKSNIGPISTYNAGHQQIMSARARTIPYSSPSTYSHSSTPSYQYNTNMNCSSQQQPMYYQNYYQSQTLSHLQNSNSIKYDSIKTQMKSKPDDSYQSSTSCYSSICSNSYIPVQQLQSQTSNVQEYQTFSNHSQIFPSPPSNPSTPYQGEFNGNTEFGVPYHQSQPSSVNSLTDALCPSGDTIDRQMTPGPPSVGTPRVASHQYSFPQTPLTPTTSRLTNEQNIDELTAFLQDPINTLLTDDLTSTFFDDIETLADTYLGGRGNSQQSNIDNKLDYDIILNYLCSDDLISTVYKN